MPWIKLRIFLQTQYPAFLSALVVFLMSFAVYFESTKQLVEKNEEYFNLRADIAKIAIEKRLRDYEQILRGVQSLVKINDTITYREWNTYVTALDVEDQYPGIQGIGYSVFFPASELEHYESQITDQDFTVWPTGLRDYYSAIIYLEPHDIRNRAAIGYDMYSDPVRRIAMHKAIVTGEPSLTSLVTLVQEISGEVQKGFLLYLPVYQKDSKPNTPEERKSQIKGFVYSPFRLGDFMTGVLSNRFEDVYMQISDGQNDHEGDQQFENYLEEHRKEVIPSLQTRRQLQLQGLTWDLLLVAKRHDYYTSNFPIYLLYGGLILSILIFVIVLILTNIKTSTYLKQLITDNTTASLFILSHDGFCSFINPASLELTGYTYDDLKRKPLFNTLTGNEEAGKAVWAEIKGMMIEGNVRNYNKRFYHQNGNAFYVNIYGSKIKRSIWNNAFLVELRDMTQLLKHEENLAKQNRNLSTLNNIGRNLNSELNLEKLLKTLVNSCSSLIRAEYGVFYQWNGSSTSIYLSDHTPETAEATSLQEIPLFKDHQNREAILIHDLQEECKSGQNSNIYVPLKHLKIRSYLAVPVISRDSKEIGGLYFAHSNPGVFTQDSSHIIQGVATQASIAIDNSTLFTELTQTNNQLVRINNDLDNFVYTASHDLKAPVLNIEGLINALLMSMEKEDGVKSQMIINMMRTSVQKFKQTIVALSKVSDTNKPTFDDLESIHLSMVVEDTLFSINDAVQDNAVLITKQINTPDFRFSRANLQSILINLITNAIKYRSTDREPTIRIAAHQDDRNLVLTIADNGLGMPERALSKVFQMFKRYHDHIEGSGIGLFLIKRIVDNYQGRIEVESKEGKGTSFTIFLPVY